MESDDDIIVKARQHSKSNTYDLTIPAVICKEYKIRQNDNFALTIEHEIVDGQVEPVLKYRRVPPKINAKN